MSELASAVKSDGTAMNVFGVIAIVLGILAMLMPGVTGLSVVTMVGVLVLLAGVVRMYWAFKAGSLGKGLFVFAIGGLTLLCGIALVGNPLFASGVLTIVLAIYFIVDGVSELVAGMQQRPQPGSGWLVFGGIVSILLGIMMWRQFPLSGVFAIGILVGIKLFTVGLIMVTGGTALRSLGKRAERA